ncbi:hypothetical protein BDV96DRAFT_598309 [Lophiotrema nucula]|uniref:Uncharacterized protein n=1 Tax=Lophiotrema nucula TaxID=690887 RepID=A0A6A5ZDZ0_9PLEO|nr:hypothetical protein BDV96DRAFT_598309 [Lophiotrema nucula]
MFFSLLFISLGVSLVSLVSALPGYIIIYTYTWADSGNSTSKQIAQYNAVFNGTLSLKMTASSKTECNMQDTIANYSMQIGAITPGGNQSLSRKSFDTNPYYFYLEGPASLNDSDGQLRMESSRDLDENATAADSMFWSVTATKNGDGWDTTGKHTLYSSYNWQALDSVCEGYFSSNVDPINNWTMTGRITETSVNMSWGPAAWSEDGVDFTRTWTFEGAWNDQGAKLEVGGASIETTGVWRNRTNDTQEGEKQSAAPSARVWSGTWVLLGLAGVFAFM